MTDKEEKRRLRREEKARFASLSGRGKWQYFKDYYLKGSVLCVVVLLILAGLCRDLYRGARDSVFYALVVNNYTPVPEEFRDGFISYAGLDEKKYNITIDSTMKIDVDRRDDMSNTYMQEIIAISSTRKQDLFLADEQIIRYYWDSGYIVDVREYLAEEFWKQYEDRFFYLPDPDGNEIPVGILASDSPVLSEYGMYEYRQPVISIVYQAPDIENIQTFISYLFHSTVG